MRLLGLGALELHPLVVEPAGELGGGAPAGHLEDVAVAVALLAVDHDGFGVGDAQRDFVGAQFVAPLGARAAVELFGQEPEGLAQNRVPVGVLARAPSSHASAGEHVQAAVGDEAGFALAIGAALEVALLPEEADGLLDERGLVVHAVRPSPAGRGAEALEAVLAGEDVGVLGQHELLDDRVVGLAEQAVELGLEAGHLGRIRLDHEAADVSRGRDDACADGHTDAGDRSKDLPDGDFGEDLGKLAFDPGLLGHEVGVELVRGADAFDSRLEGVDGVAGAVRAQDLVAGASSQTVADADALTHGLLALLEEDAQASHGHIDGAHLVEELGAFAEESCQEFGVVVLVAVVGPADVAEVARGDAPDLDILVLPELEQVAGEETGGTAEDHGHAVMRLDADEGRGDGHENLEDGLIAALLGRQLADHAAFVSGFVESLALDFGPFQVMVLDPFDLDGLAGRDVAPGDRGCAEDEVELGLGIREVVGLGGAVGVQEEYLGRALLALGGAQGTDADRDDAIRGHGVYLSNEQPEAPARLGRRLISRPYLETQYKYREKGASSYIRWFAPTHCIVRPKGEGLAIISALSAKSAC